MSIRTSGGTGGRGFLHSGNLYLTCLGGSLPSAGSMAVGGGSGLQGSVGGCVGVGCACGIGCNLGPIIFILAFALPCPFLGSTGGIIFCGRDTDLGITGMACESLLF